MQVAVFWVAPFVLDALYGVHAIITPPGIVGENELSVGAGVGDPE